MAEFSKLNGYDVKDAIGRELTVEVKDELNADDFILAVFHDYISDTYYNPYTGGVGDGRTPRFLLSKDGVNFTEFNKAIYPLMISGAPSTPTGWVGAPSIVFWKDKFFILTSGGLKNAVNDGAIGVSDDLIHWTWYDYTLGVRYEGAQVIIPAPELCILNGELYLIESIYTGTDVSDYNGVQVEECEPYIAKVESFDETNGFTFSGVRKLIFYESGNANLSPNKTHIDTTMIYKDGTYYALSKNDITKAIESFSSTDLTNWTMLNANVFWRYVEAPTVCYYGGTFHVWGDASQLEAGSQNEMYHCTTDDFITFIGYDDVKAPRKFTTRHGSAITITDSKAKEILRNVPDFELGDIGIKRAPLYLGLSTNEIPFPIQTDNIRETLYMSICPNTIYYIRYSRDHIIDYLDNKADVGVVDIVFTPDVNEASLTIKNSGREGNYTEVNDYYHYKDGENPSRKITLMKDLNGNLRICESSATVVDLLSYFSSMGTFSDSTSWVQGMKNGNNICLNIRLRGFNSDTHFVSTALPAELRPNKNMSFVVTIRDGIYTTANLYTVYLLVNTSGKIEIYSNTTIPSNAILEAVINYQKVTKTS